MNSIQPSEFTITETTLPTSLPQPVIAPSPSPTTPPPKIIDTLKIPFPKTIEELSALDSSREIPYLKALCNRRHIQTPGPNPSPSEIIPILEQRLAQHQTLRPGPPYQKSDLYTDWSATLADLQQFLSQLHSLLSPNPTASPAAPPPLTAPPAPKSIPSVQTLPPNPPPTENPFHTNPFLAFSCLQNSSPSSSASSAVKPSSPLGHFNKLNARPPKTAAISTNPNLPPKNLGHSNNPPPKISPRPQSASSASNTPSEINNPKATCVPQSGISNLESVIPSSSQSPDLAPKSAIRRIHPVLSRLTPDQKQKLIHLYEQHDAKDASRLAAEKLCIQISPATLSRLYTTWRIKEDEQTRQDLEAEHGTACPSGSVTATLTEKQLQLRLLELASRPNMDHTELRAICHSFARLQSVKLSERRVQLAESKEARLTASSGALKPFTDEEYEESIRALIGQPADEPAEDHHEPSQTPTSPTAFKNRNIPDGATPSCCQFSESKWDFYGAED